MFISLLIAPEEKCSLPNLKKILIYQVILNIESTLEIETKTISLNLRRDEHRGYK